MRETVAILGASHKPSRYSHKAQMALIEHGYRVFPVNKRYREVEGLQCFPDLVSCPAPIDTITVYVGPKILRDLVNDILGVNPRRVILNPGTEDREIEQSLSAAGITVENACTLIMLSIGQF